MPSSPPMPGSLSTPAWSRPSPRSIRPRATAPKITEARGGSRIMAVHTSIEGPVLVVTIDRPEARNAVDGPTAVGLAAAFRSFELDSELTVAVLTGAGGTFCAGADLKAVATDNGNRVDMPPA